MRVECDNCGSSGHPTYACTRPAKKSTTSGSNVGRGGASSGFETQRAAVKGQQHAVDTNGERARLPASTDGAGSIPAGTSEVRNLGSPTKFDKTAYQAKYMREVYRPRLKAKKEAAK